MENFQEWLQMCIARQGHHLDDFRSAFEKYSVFGDNLKPFFLRQSPFEMWELYLPHPVFPIRWLAC